MEWFYFSYKSNPIVDTVKFERTMSEKEIPTRYKIGSKMGER